MKPWMKPLDVEKIEIYEEKDCYPVLLKYMDESVILVEYSVKNENFSWITSGNKVFHTNGTAFDFGVAYLGRLGYYFCLKVCMFGLVLMTDI
jgi:hypothetical protein